MKNQSQETAFIRKALSKEVAYIAAIITALWFYVTTIYLPLQSVIQSVHTIQNNELVHLQADINDLKAGQAKQNDTHMILLEDLGEIKGALGIKK